MELSLVIRGSVDKDFYKMFATKLCYFENLKVCEMMIKVFNKIQDLGDV